jgi:LacI family transcriptional regulator
MGVAPQIYTAAQRHRGYIEAMAAAGLAVDSSWVSQSAPTPDSVQAALRQMLAASATAVLCGNNRISVTALRALAVMGRPDLAFVSFDDFELADLLTPAVTVVAQDVASLGRVAAELLFRRLEGDRRPAEHTEVPTRLIPRGSGEIPPG